MIRASSKCLAGIQADLQILPATACRRSTNRIQTKGLADAHVDGSRCIYFQRDAGNNLIRHMRAYGFKTERQSQQRTPWSSRVRAVSTDGAQITGSRVSG